MCSGVLIYLFSITNVPCTEAMCSQLSKLFFESPRILKCCWQLWVHHPGYCNQKSLIKWTGLKRGMSRLQKTWADRKLERRHWNEDEQCEARKRENLRKKWTVEYPLPLAKWRGFCCRWMILITLRALKLCIPSYQRGPRPFADFPAKWTPPYIPSKRLFKQYNISKHI